jgi:hypothetical protein
MKNVNVHHKMKNVNVHHYRFLSETYKPVARGTCPLSLSSIFLIRIYSTRTITRRRSQGTAPGLSLSIILTLLSMCGTKISQGMTCTIDAY